MPYGKRLRRRRRSLIAAAQDDDVKVSHSAGHVLDPAGPGELRQILAAAVRVADPSLLLSDEGVAGDFRQVPPTPVRPPRSTPQRLVG